MGGSSEIGRRAEGGIHILVLATVMPGTFGCSRNDAGHGFSEEGHSFGCLTKHAQIKVGPKGEASGTLCKILHFKNSHVQM